MKRPILATLAVASLATMSLTGATAANAISPAAATVAVAAPNGAAQSADVSQLRQEFNDYIAGLDLDHLGQRQPTSGGQPHIECSRVIVQVPEHLVRRQSGPRDAHRRHRFPRHSNSRGPDPTSAGRVPAGQTAYSRPCS